MIKSKKDLDFYIAADRIMNGLPAKRGLKELLFGRILGGAIIDYLRSLRKYEFYSNTTHSSFTPRVLLRFVWGCRFRRLGMKLGFSIGRNILGYGVVIPHYGTIVINGEANIGNFCVLHTSICIAGGNKNIGDYFYLSAGSQLIGNITLGDGVTVAAHSLVKDSADSNTLMAGSPAVVKREQYPIWPERDGSKYTRRVEKVMSIRKQIYGM